MVEGMRQLVFRRPAAEARAHYREHDPDRSAAHEEALQGIRDGSGRDRAIRAGQLGAHLTHVRVKGRDINDVIVWEVENDDRAVIIYLGPVNP
jgi:hypothetical protein